MSKNNKPKQVTSSNIKPPKKRPNKNVKAPKNTLVCFSETPIKKTKKDK